MADTCKTCRFWKRTRGGSGATQEYGSCGNLKFVDVGPPPKDGLVHWESSGEGESLLETGEDFGCIHHEQSGLASVVPFKVA